VPLAEQPAQPPETSRHASTGRRKTPEWFDDYDLRYDQWLADPSYAPWSIRATASKETGDIVGSMNCHHQPMPFLLKGKERLATEMGYTILEAYRPRASPLKPSAFITWAKPRDLKASFFQSSPATRLRAPRNWAQPRSVRKSMSGMGRKISYYFDC
jgi:hypothetical protein